MHYWKLTLTANAAVQLFRRVLLSLRGDDLREAVQLWLDQAWDIYADLVKVRSRGNQLAQQEIRDLHTILRVIDANASYLDADQGLKTRAFIIALRTLMQDWDSKDASARTIIGHFVIDGKRLGFSEEMQAQGPQPLTEAFLLAELFFTAYCQLHTITLPFASGIPAQQTHLCTDALSLLLHDIQFDLAPQLAQRTPGEMLADYLVLQRAQLLKKEIEVYVPLISASYPTLNTPLNAAANALGQASCLFENKTQF